MQLAKEFRAKVAAAGLQDEVAVVDVGCHGQCALAPVVVIEPQNYFYGGVKPGDVDEIIEVTLRGGKPVERLCQRVDGQRGHDGRRGPVLPQPAARRARPIADGSIPSGSTTRSHGAPTPPCPRRSTSMKPEEVIEEVRESGLRGAAAPDSPPA